MSCFTVQSPNATATPDLTGNRDGGVFGYFANDSSCGAGDGTGIDASDLNKIYLALNTLLDAAGIDCATTDIGDTVRDAVAALIAVETAARVAGDAATLAAANTAIANAIAAHIAAYHSTPANLNGWGVYLNWTGSQTLPPAPASGGAGYWGGTIDSQGVSIGGTASVDAGTGTNVSGTVAGFPGQTIVITGPTPAGTAYLHWHKF